MSGPWLVKGERTFATQNTGLISISCKINPWMLSGARIKVLVVLQQQYKGQETDDSSWLGFHLCRGIQQSRQLVYSLHTSVLSHVSWQPKFQTKATMKSRIRTEVLLDFTFRLHCRKDFWRNTPCTTRITMLVKGTRVTPRDHSLKQPEGSTHVQLKGLAGVRGNWTYLHKKPESFMLKNKLTYFSLQVSMNFVCFWKHSSACSNSLTQSCECMSSASDH